MSRNKEAMPWSKFWWKDYDSDKALRRCSFEAQGLWMRLLCLMAEGEPYGHLQVEGRAPTPADIALMVGCKLTDRRAARMMEELRQAGVFSVTEDGIPYCRRMVRDAGRRAEAQANGARGGNPALLKPQNSRQTSGKQSENISEDCAPESKPVSSNINEVAGKGVNPQPNPQDKPIIPEARGYNSPPTPHELPRPRTPPPTPSGPAGDLLGLINPTPSKPLVPEQVPSLPIHTGKPKKPARASSKTEGKAPRDRWPKPKVRTDPIPDEIGPYRVQGCIEECLDVLKVGSEFWLNFRHMLADMLAEGADMDRDILPVMKEAKRKGVDNISGSGWFAYCIRERMMAAQKANAA